MIKIENVEVMGWEAAIRGMRNPMNSWDKSDSHYWESSNRFEVGSNDLDLMRRLRAAGTDHGKFMRMLTVYLDITAPLYWWKEFDTYKVGTVANSCSTMHKIQAKEFTLDDFSHEHLIDDKSSTFNLYDEAGEYTGYDMSPKNVLQFVCNVMNIYRENYLETKDKNDWWQMIQLLPSSYNQRRTVMLNYEVLANTYKSRKNHKLNEWVDFCKWIETLPYSELITGGKKEEN